MGVLRPFGPSDHGCVAPALKQLRDLTHARWPDAEFGSSGWGEITLRFRAARPKPITIYAARPVSMAKTALHKTGHFWRPETSVDYYFTFSRVGKAVWILARQLRGPHLRMWT